MEYKSLDECIAQIKTGKKVEARQLLQKILESDPHYVNGWYWYVETFDTPEEKLKALRLCLKYNPDNQKVKDAIQTFETKYPQVIKSQPINKKSVSQKGHPNKSKKRNKILWIIGTILGIGIFGILSVLVIGFVIRNQLPVATSPAKPTSVPTITNTPKPFTGSWKSSTSQSEFDNSKTVTLSLEAENKVEAWLSTTLPTLVLRCEEGEINVYVDVGTQSNVEYGHYDSATVRVRFDENQAGEVLASESTDGEALFFPDPEGMIIAMLRSNKMVFGFTPLNSDPAVTTFDLRGLVNVIEPLKRSCNWNGTYPTTPPLPTLSPTATPLPSGSALSISGYNNEKWKIEIERIEVTNSVTAFGNTHKADGQFVLLFLQVTNTGNDPQFFIGFGNIQIRDANGTTYDEDTILTESAAEMYGMPLIGNIQPGDVVQELVAFDLPLDSSFYLLVPGSVATDNGQSIIIEAP